MNRTSFVSSALSFLTAACIALSSTNAHAATAATPTFSPAGGTYNSTQTVTISDSTSGATIYYTTDGSTPTTSSTKYQGTAISVSVTTKIQAIATATGFTQSSVGAATYTIVPPGTSGTLQVFISPPGAQSTTVSGVATETFDSLSTGNRTTSYTSTGIGTYAASSSNPFNVHAPDVYGGATDSTHTSHTNYFAVGSESGSTASVTLTLNNPATYFGFWWSAGDANNRVALYSGSTLYGTFSTADLLSFLNNGQGSITASNGTQYTASSYFGNPNYASGSNDGTEPFAYVSFVITGNATINKIVFYNLNTTTGFESDNHSVIFSGNSVVIPGTYVPVEVLTLGTQVVAPVFNPPAGNYSASQTVSITTTTAGASINYTTDGSTPTTSHGTLYSSPISIAQTETVQAVGFETGLTTSSVSSAAYTIPVAPTISAWPTASAITYGQTLASSTLSGGTASVPGTFAWTTPTTAPKAGTQSESVTFTPTDTIHYKAVTGTVNVTVNKATPTISVWPTASTITYGQTLAASTLTGGTSTVQGIFTWTTPTTAPRAGTQSEGVTFTPTDSTDYNTVTGTVSLTVSKATPTISSLPSASAITYGQALTSSTLSGGSATSGGNTIAGAFSWTTPTTAPGVGAPSESVTFTPTDTTDYATVTTSVTLTVVKAAPSCTWPTASGIVYGQTLASSTLSGGSCTNPNNAAKVAGAFSWTTASTVPPAGTQSESVTFTPTDATDYATAAASVTLTVNKATLTITASSPTAAYGSAAPTITPTYSGFVNGDSSASLTTAPTCTTAYTTASTVGSNPSTSCSGAVDANYSMTYVAGKVTVVKAAPSCTWPTASGIVYGQSLASSTLSGGSCTNPNNAATVAGAFSWTTASTAPPAGTQSESVTFTPTDATDYNAPAGTANVSVANATLTVTGITANNKTYDGTTAATLNTVGASLVGVVSGDTVTLNTSGAAGTFAQSAVGSNITVTITGLTLSGASAGNYTLTQPTTTASITSASSFTLSASTPSLNIVQGKSGTSTITVNGTNGFSGSVNLAASGLPSGVTATFATNPATSSSVMTLTASGTATAGPATVTITGTSGSITASATISLTVTVQCATNGYTYVRAIDIDHTKVPNTDQINFPFLFNTTDPLLATIANNGHVSSPEGYDIIFTSDPGGQNPLPYEMEQYNPTTGQVVAWVKIPDLSHTSDTVIYLFYGNPNVSTSQQNPTAVWDANYMGVWHLPNGTTLSANDSTANGNNGRVVGATATAGKIDGGLNNPNSTSGYIDLSSTSLAEATPSAFTLEAWIDISAFGSYPAIVDFDAGNSNNWGIYGESGNGIGLVVANSMHWMIPSGSFSLGWNQIVATSNATGPAMYLNGFPAGESWSDSSYDNGTASASIGLGYSGALFNGLIDEVRVSSIVRSPDWIATEYANQGLPSTFYSLTVENAIQAVPEAVSLSASQSQQFAIPGACTGGVAWSMANDAPGVLSSSGLYTAPPSITQPQTVAITGETQNGGPTTATVTLIPQIWPIGGPAGTVVTISGQGFGSSEGLSSVTVGGLPAVTLAWSGSQIQLQIPTGTGLGNQEIVVTVNDQTVAQTTFNVTTGMVGVTPSSTGLRAATTVNSASQTALLIFNGTAGQIVSFQQAGDTFSNGCAGFEILNPDGSQLYGKYMCAGQISDPNVLPSTGIYTLVVNSGLATAGSTSFTLWQFSNLTGTITPGVTYPLSITIPDQAALLSFSGTSGQVVSFQQVEDTFSGGCAVFVILNPDGSQLYGRNICAGQTSDPSTLPSNGTYTLVVNPQGATGSSSIILWEFSNLTGTITPNVPYPVSLNIPEQQDWLSFTGTAGQFVAVQATSSTFSTYCSEVDFWILNPDGSTLGSPWLCNGGLTSPYTLPATGTYTLVVRPPGTGSGIITLWEFSNLTGTITPEIPKTVTINIPQQQEMLTFSGVAGQVANVAISNDTLTSWNGSVTFTILNPDGTTLYSNSLCDFTFVGCQLLTSSVVLPQTGTYTLVVNPQGGTGSVTLLLQEFGNLTGTIIPGVPYPLTISIPGQEDLLSFSGTAGKIVNVQLVSSTFSTFCSGLTFSIVAPDGSTLSTQGPCNGGTTNFVTLPTGGVYTLLVVPGNATGSATLMLTETVPSLTVTPPGLNLTGGQSQQFAANVASGTSGPSITWTLTPATGAGTLSSSGLYTAPATISTKQVVTVTASAVTNNGTLTGAAQVQLTPPSPSVAVQPLSATLIAGQSQQYNATVTNASSTSVLWSMSPAGAGTINSSGLYTAPPVVTARQVVTITATSQLNPAFSASATLTLLPANCAAQSYGYERPIVIDHTKVPESDESNFPFYFATTDPLLASISNGGHMASANGYDVQFSSDPAGEHTLSYELEQYNAATGQVVAWIKVPVLSHTQDTVIYLFYGNSAINAPQQNPAGVWDSNYLGVYQFDNMQSGVVPDLTSNGNHALGSLQQTAGTPGGAAIFDGTSSVTLPANDFPSFPVNGSSGTLFNSSIAVWFKTPSSGIILDQTGPEGSGNSMPALYIDVNGSLRANFFDLQNAQQIVSPTALNDNNWHYAVLTFDTNAIEDTSSQTNSQTWTGSGIETLYVDGQVIGSQTGAIPIPYSSAYSYFVGTGNAASWAGTPNLNGGWFGFNGSLDQIEISSSARSDGWVQAEYNNQSSPSTFFALGTETGATLSVNPSTVTLYQSQSQQLTVLQTGMCNAGNAVWSMPAGSPGTLSPTGLYTAPAAIDTPQTVTVTGTTLGANSSTINATITLMPPITISVSPGVASLPTAGTQQFTAAVTNTNNAGITWSINPAGAGSISATGLYTAPATFSGGQTVTVIATSLADPTQSASATVSLGAAAPLPVSVSLSPRTVWLYPSQTQQFTQRFTATVTNATNTAVTWSISPAGVGTIDNTGLYTAPTSAGSQQSVTITATSQADPTQSASASVVLAPACTSNGYGYVRAITIDHTKVPNTDQISFPFLFSTTDPLLATIANGGHVQNSSGYDMIFTSDPAGQNPLPYEMEEYNPQNGTVVAWVQIPDLSHSSDTVIYLFYGNPNVAASQQNPAGVWNSNFLGVWHLPNGTSLSANDSTANANNGISEGGVSATSGEIDGAAMFDGSTGYIATSNQMNGPTVYSLSTWFNTTTKRGGRLIGFGSSQTGSSSTIDRHIYMSASGQIVFGNWTGSAAVVTSTASYNDGRWHSVVGTLSAAGQSLYIDGALIGTITNTSAASYSGYWRLGFDAVDSLEGFWPNQPGTDYYGGSLDEARVSGIAESADWIATEYANQSSPATFFALSPEDSAGIAPVTATLYANQSQQFTAPGLCSAGVSWTLSSGAQGTLNSSGLYTAPSTISEQQTFTVTAANQANPAQSASATVTLMPPVSVGISPASLTLNQNQNQQFTAIVNNSFSQAVTWTMSPAGLGSLDENGGYIAPASISTQQTVTITATSVTDPTKSASAMITLAPSICASTGYGNQRVILIDHTKVPNTDQINFPFLFNTTDPDLRTIDNGGHVANLNGYDIIFSSDPSGQTRLDFEVEQYNPVTGQLVAWIRIPTLSHSSDTVIYVFYGNSAIMTSQSNPTGVWDSNYQAVYHLGNLPWMDIADDSTTNANNASFNNFIEEPGQIDGSAGLDGVTSYLQIPSAAFLNYPTGVFANLGIQSQQISTGLDATFSIWFKTNSWGGLLDQTAGDTCTFGFLTNCFDYGPEQAGDLPAGTWRGILDVSLDGNLVGNGAGSSPQTYNDNNWHFASVTFENGVNKLYADGQLVSTGTGGNYGYSPTYAYFVGAADPETDDEISADLQPWKYLPGQLDEINVSSTARSGDWIQTQFNNQSSPSTFYKFYSPTAVQVAPSSISLYASQSELFTVPGTCDASISWSLSNGSPGILTSAGLYTAPPNVSSQQTVTVSATSQSNNSSLGLAQVTLLPAPQPLTLVASSPSPYQVGRAQSFTATLLDQQGNPLSGVTVNFTVGGPNETVGSILTSANGTASFSYTGTNTGTDTVQATASVDGALLTSNSLTAAWLTPPPAQAPTLTLLTQPSVGRGALMGAFTDSNGNLIEPIEIGTAARTFITPAGATQLQLGINDTYYEINGGSGFVVAVNGSNVNVPPTAMPWKWKTGGLNNNYQYGVNDGTAPKIAATHLTTGQLVTIAYQNGTVSTNYPVAAPVNANGDPSSITGTQIFNGAYFPTLYTTGTAYPQNQPINVFATVVDASGAPIPNTPVTLTISGANPGQLEATTDATGTASFLYSGQYAGNDSLQAQAALAGQGTLDSNQTTIHWTNYPTPPPVGSLSLNIGPIPDVNVQGISAIATDASGNLLPNENVGFYITGADNIQTSVGTNNIGEAFYLYYHINAGTYNIIAVDSVNRNVIVTQPYTNTWVIPTGSPTNAGGTLTIGISANTSVNIPNPLQLTGTVTDNSGLTPTLAWTQVSGPGTVSFATPTQASTTATFSEIGTYVLQLSANDTANSGWAQFTVTVLAPSVASQAQGWIGSPAYGATVSGVVPITLAQGVTLASGTLTYAPASNPNNTTVLNANVSGSGQIGTLDATSLPNGSYLIQMQGTDTNSNSQYSLVLVTVAGNYKPGRVTTTVADLVVPATGLAIQIQRTYDSLNASTSGDFGYGWNLGINTQLTVDNSGNVTFTLGGQRKTFYLTPTYGGWLFPWYSPAFTPQPGAFGTLADTGSSCPLDFLVPNGSLWNCFGGSGQYSPSGYVYTDPNGTAYTMSAGGQLQSVTDKNGNGLTIAANGITSTTGLNVPFVRDAQNRITQITDPAGNVYSYAYDANGNLASVTYPPTPNAPTCAGASATNTSQYSYYPDTQHPNYPAHYYAGGTDGRCNPLPSTTFFPANTLDASGQYSVAGKLASVTDAAGKTTSYAYNLATNTTVITYPTDPADGNGQTATATMVYDSNGDVLSSTDPLGHTTTNRYDANFNLLSTTDPLGHTTSYTYDANGNKTSTTYPNPQLPGVTNTTSTTNYNQFSEPVSTTDENGNTRTFAYDANFNPLAVTDSAGTLMSTQFNAAGQMISGAIGYDLTQNPAHASQFTYDANGNLISKTDALGRTTSYTYNALGQKITMTEPIPTGSTAAQATTTYTYDAYGNVTETQAPLGRTTSSTYDSNGNKLSDTDARGYTTSYTYDNLNRLIETDYPTSPVTKATKTYDFRGNVVTETDQNGNVTLHQYDLAGRQISVTQAYGTSNATTTQYTYYDDGKLKTETDALGHATTTTYDAAGNLIATSGVKGNFAYAYDNARNRISMTDGKGNTTQYAYDARKRLTTTTYPDQTTKTNAYDGPGNLISVTDQAQNVVQYNYDAANQLINVVQTASPNTGHNTTIYGYDANGNPITLQDANTHITTNAFDLASELTSKLLPDGTHTETRTYDNNGNLQTVTHFNGVVTTYTYDQLNRLLSRTTPGDATVSFTYTATGKRHTMTDQSGTTTYGYDSMDRLSSKATPEGTLSYTYDAAGNLATMTSNHAHGVSVTYGYDDLNRLSTVADANLTGVPTNITQYSYDNANNVGSVQYPNGVTTQFTYDLLNRVESAASTTGSGQFSSYTYQRNPTGTLKNVVELGGRTVNWTYDGIYRLTNESITSDPSNHDGSVAYTLDPVGNRDSVVSSLGGVPAGSWGYNSDDEVSTESYDPNGNVTATGGKSFTYDSENHMMTMSATGTSVSMVYDGDGNRVAKTVNGVTTYYLVDDLNPTGYPQVVEELSSAANVERQYSYGLMRIDEEQVLNGAWTASFYGYDGGGSVRQLTNTAGAVTDTYEYDAFGNAVQTSGSTPNVYLYRGEQYDSDLGLYYLRARYYNPTTGRFMSRDPLKGIWSIPSTLHKYLYAGGDAENLADPTGRSLEEVGLMLVKTVQAAPVFAAIGCGTELGISVAAGMLIESLKDSIGDVYNGVGCLQMFIQPAANATGELVQVGLDALSAAACMDSFIVMVADENAFLKHPSAEADDKVNYDFIQGETGCLITLIGILMTP